MPHAPRKPCKAPNCPGRAVAGERFCEAHLQVWRRQYDRQRGTRQERGYGARWQRLRRMVLNSEPLCRECKRRGIDRLANEVDHIDGNVWNLAWENLQPLCKSCHSQKTARETRWGAGPQEPSPPGCQETRGAPTSPYEADKSGNTSTSPDEPGVPHSPQGLGQTP